MQDIIEKQALIRNFQEVSTITTFRDFLSVGTDETKVTRTFRFSVTSLPEDAVICDVLTEKMSTENKRPQSFLRIAFGSFPQRCDNPVIVVFPW